MLMEVVRRLDLAVPDDVHVALEAEAQRLVEGAALLRIGDPDHRVQEVSMPGSYGPDSTARSTRRHGTSASSSMSWFAQIRW